MNHTRAAWISVQTGVSSAQEMFSFSYLVVLLALLRFSLRCINLSRRFYRLPNTSFLYHPNNFCYTLHSRKQKRAHTHFYFCNLFKLPFPLFLFLLIYFILRPLLYISSSTTHYRQLFPPFIFGPYFHSRPKVQDDTCGLFTPESAFTSTCVTQPALGLILTITKQGG